MQTILVFVLFALALGYLGWRVYKRFSVKEVGCGKGCGCASDNQVATQRNIRLPSVR
ncbi:FeoB-associated Cys-rich membrane protein [Fibrella sp. ES10-3-2-2]